MAPKKTKALTKKQAAVIERFLAELAPPGQFEAVAAGIQRLLPPEQALSDAELQRLARLHWATHGGLGRREQGGARGGEDKVLLHAWAEAEEGESDEGLAYLDPASRRIVTVDRRTGVVVAEADAPPPAAAAASEGRDVEGVAEAVASYVAAQYATEAATSAVFPGGGDSSDDGNASDGVLFRVAIYAEKPSLRNFWAGSWLSLWEVAASGGGSSSAGEKGGLIISGRVRVRAHFFEEGNMRMETAKACPPAPLDDESTPLPAAVVAAIGGFESELQRSLDAAYAGLGEEGLKALRRKLSLSKQRMEWSAAIHRVSRLK